jgi:hypothetical protein
MELLSTEIPDDEVIVRALKNPVHVNRKNGKLKSGAYMPPPGKSIISVARIPGVVASKAAVKKSIADANNPAISYIGFSAIYASTVREARSEVVDAPEDYYGHAHIDHKIKAPDRNEPQDPEVNEIYITKIKVMLEKAKAYIDPAPDELEWTGPDLLPP